MRLTPALLPLLTVLASIEPARAAPPKSADGPAAKHLKQSADSSTKAQPPRQGEAPKGARKTAPAPAGPAKKPGPPDTSTKKPIIPANAPPKAPIRADDKAASAALPPTSKTAKEPPAGPPAVLALQVQKATLENGLRVVMNIDHTSPTIAVAVTYDVGARNEERGRSGFAHLFEHMMFEGSANVPKGDHFKLISSHGGTLNGTTSSDRTNYFEMLPASELPLALWLEADRMKSLDVSQNNFENQRKVVQEEYRMRVSNVAYAPAQIRLGELVFQGYWPYEHDAIGSMQDLDNAQLDWVRAFHGSHYAPNLAVLSIAGDFDPDEALQLVHRFFDTARKQDKPVAYAPSAAPDQSSPRIAVLEDPHAKTPAFFYAWMGPPSRDADHYPLELAINVLTDGESSRLHQKLVRDRALAQDVSGWTDDHRGPDLVGLNAKLTEGAKMADVEKIIDIALESLAKDGPTEAEMVKVRNRTQSAFLFGLQSNLSRAVKLGEYELFWGDARLLNSEPQNYLAVTKDDIKRVVARYLVPQRRSTVEVHPTAAEPGSPKSAAVDKAAGPSPAPSPAAAKENAKASEPKKSTP